MYFIRSDKIKKGVLEVGAGRTGRPAMDQSAGREGGGDQSALSPLLVMNQGLAGWVLMAAAVLCGGGWRWWLQISKKQEFEEKGYYTWIYEGPQAISNLMTFLIIAGFLAITCFPIWPHFLKASDHC